MNFYVRYYSTVVHSRSDFIVRNAQSVQTLAAWVDGRKWKQFTEHRTVCPGYHVSVTISISRACLTCI